MEGTSEERQETDPQSSSWSKRVSAVSAFFFLSFFSMSTQESFLLQKHVGER